MEQSCNTQQMLNNIEYNNTITYIPNIQFAKVIKVYDGDTITIGTIIDNTNIYYRFTVRLKGIDCPEIKSKDTQEQLCAQIAKETLHKLIYNQIIQLQNI